MNPNYLGNPNYYSSNQQSPPRHQGTVNSTTPQPGTSRRNIRCAAWPNGPGRAAGERHWWPQENWRLVLRCYRTYLSRWLGYVWIKHFGSCVWWFDYWLNFWQFKEQSQGSTSPTYLRSIYCVQISWAQFAHAASTVQHGNPLHVTCTCGRRRMNIGQVLPRRVSESGTT